MIMATAGRQKLKWRAKRLRPTHHLHLVIVGTSNGNVLEHSSTVDPEALTHEADAPLDTALLMGLVWVARLGREEVERSG